MSPLFLEFLMGKRNYTCTPWGMPTYNIFGWQKPCYLLQDGYADTFAELMAATEWENYGTESGNPKCANCMVHSGYEASAVNRHIRLAARHLWPPCVAMVSGNTRTRARALLNEASRPVHSYNPLVQIQSPPKPGRRNTRMSEASIRMLLADPSSVWQADTLEVVSGTSHEKMQGRIPDLATQDDLLAALEKAFDYRGDVTITRKDGSKSKDTFSIAELPPHSPIPLSAFSPKTPIRSFQFRFPISVRLEFTGRDTASGKSWEAWVKKYWEKRASGEKGIALNPESLE